MFSKYKTYSMNLMYALVLKTHLLIFEIGMHKVFRKINTS